MKKGYEWLDTLSQREAVEFKHNLMLLSDNPIKWLNTTIDKITFNYYYENLVVCMSRVAVKMAYMIEKYPNDSDLGREIRDIYG